LRNGDIDVSVPEYLKPTNYVDMKNDQNFNEKFDELLRMIYKEGKYDIPKLGSKPELPKSGSKYDIKNVSTQSTMDDQTQEIEENINDDGISISPDHSKKTARDIQLSIFSSSFKDAIENDDWAMKRSGGNTPIILINLIPHEILNCKRNYDLDEDQIKIYLQPIGSTSWDTRITSNGIISTTPWDGEKSYVLIRWNGIIEAYDERVMRLKEMNGDNQYGKKILSLKDLKSIIENRIKGYVKALLISGVKLPIEVKITLMGVGDFCAVELGYDALEKPILENDLELESCTIVDPDSIEKSLMPAFDSMARACGLSKYSKIQ